MISLSLDGRACLPLPAGRQGQAGVRVRVRIKKNQHEIFSLYCKVLKL
jgi:hypothetical protein